MELIAKLANHDNVRYFEEPAIVCILYFGWRPLITSVLDGKTVFKVLYEPNKLLITTTDCNEYIFTYDSKYIYRNSHGDVLNLYNDNDFCGAIYYIDGEPNYTYLPSEIIWTLTSSSEIRYYSENFKKIQTTPNNVLNIIRLYTEVKINDNISIVNNRYIFKNATICKSSGKIVYDDQPEDMYFIIGADQINYKTGKRCGLNILFDYKASLTIDNDIVLINKLYYIENVKKIEAIFDYNGTYFCKQGFNFVIIFPINIKAPIRTKMSRIDSFFLLLN